MNFKYCLHGNCFNNTPKPRKNAVKNEKSQNTAELNQVSSQYTKYLYETLPVFCYCTKKQNSLINLLSFTENTIKCTSQLHKSRNR